MQKSSTEGWRQPWRQACVDSFACGNAFFGRAVGRATSDVLKTTTLTLSLSQRGMSSSNHASALVVCALALAMACTALAQNSQQDVLDAHNSARAAVGVGPVSWDDNITSYADKFAKKRVADCQLVHSGGPYGENLFWGTGRAFTLTDAVNAWIDEKRHYDYESNSCADGMVCRHYTQVVWQNTKAIGCARTLCSDGSSVFVVCDYSPAGNLVGVRPYEEKAQEDNILRFRASSTAAYLVVKISP